MRVSSVVDLLPLQRLCYNDPNSRSSTNNDVVRETTVRTLKITLEVNQEIAVVTYNLAIASKAYVIQTIEAPRFDKVLILLGNFHVELASFGAMGTFLHGSGIKVVLTESDILAEELDTKSTVHKTYSFFERRPIYIGQIMV